MNSPVDATVRRRSIVRAIMRASAGLLLLWCIYLVASLVANCFRSLAYGPRGWSNYRSYGIEFAAGIITPLTLLSVLVLGERRFLRWIVPLPRPRCPECEYPVDPSISPRCPECGARFIQQHS